MKPKARTYEYKIENQAGNYLHVCRETFLNVLNITKHRIIGVFTKFKNGVSKVPVETRGGDHKQDKFGNKRESVLSFIKTLKGCESHYGRGKSSRTYLSSDLTIGKLFKMYNAEQTAENLKVKRSFFYKIFSTKFNIGFSTPAVDECSTCLQLDSKIELHKGDQAKLEILKAHKVIHIKQAKSFFSHLKEKKRDCFLMSYDCQKNLVLPKVSDQQAYYSRQLYCYNLSVTKGVSSDSLTPENVSIYTWTENEAKKSSNEVASVVFNELTSVNLQGYTTIRLVADGCPGQNKNVNVLTMAAKWLKVNAPPSIKHIELVFPVTGHSFLPADRVFGLIEQRLKKKKTILTPEEYHSVFAEHGTVKKIGIDWMPFDWKTVAQQSVKSAAQLHFKLSKCRKVFIMKTKKGTIMIRGENSYQLMTGADKPFLKTGRGGGDLQPTIIPLGVAVKKEKLNDVNNLLVNHFGSNWKEVENLRWYKEVLKTPTVDDQDCDFECECQEELFDDTEIVTEEINE